MATGTTAKSSVIGQEIAHFTALAEEWWDEGGKFRMLHRLNPVRVAYIRDHAGAPLKDLRVLDIGCGGGILSEALARLGARVVAADASEKLIGVAVHHGRAAGLDIDYRCTTAEDLAAAGESFDLVCALEIVEHVADVDSFLACCGTLTKPGGRFFAATINRTLQAYALAIVGAEYLLHWVPRGSHRWDKFVTPSELGRGMRKSGLRLEDVTGIVFNPLTGDWRASRNTSVNYMVAARRV